MGVEGCFRPHCAGTDPNGPIRTYWRAGEGRDIGGWGKGGILEGYWRVGVLYHISPPPGSRRKGTAAAGRPKGEIGDPSLAGPVFTYSALCMAAPLSMATQAAPDGPFRRSRLHLATTGRRTGRVATLGRLRGDRPCGRPQVAGPQRVRPYDRWRIICIMLTCDKGLRASKLCGPASSWRTSSGGT